MPRTVRVDDYNAKRNEILNAALRLINAHGFEQVTINDLLEELNISRGALYHYFDTKHAVLDALVDRMAADGLQSLVPIVEDSRLSAVEKLRRYFAGSAQVKDLHRGTVETLSSAWFSDGNALIRQKLVRTSLEVTAPTIIEPIIRQGVDEGSFSVRFPAEAAKVVTGVTVVIGDAMMEALLDGDPSAAGRDLEVLLFTYFDAIERILGAPGGSLTDLTAEVLARWVGHDD